MEMTLVTKARQRFGERDFASTAIPFRRQFGPEHFPGAFPMTAK
jgi:hypothetical protein